MKRGEIWLCDAGEPRGSEMGYRRPVLIVENNDILKTRLASVVVVPLTTSMTYVGSTTTALLPAKRCRLPHDSVALTYLVTAVDRGQLLKKIGMVPADLMEMVDFGLQTTLDLKPW